MRLEEKRKRNIVSLWRQRGILQKDFAKLVGTTPNTFNQYVTGVRNVGNRMARKVEIKLKLSEGWMDDMHPEEWELSNSAYDGRVRPRALSRIGATLAARIDALTDERAIEKVTEFLELLEERQARTEGNVVSLFKPKPD